MKPLRVVAAFLWLPTFSAALAVTFGWSRVFVAAAALCSIPSAVPIAVAVASYRRDRWFDRQFEPPTTTDPAEAGKETDPR